VGQFSRALKEPGSALQTSGPSQAPQSHRANPEACCRLGRRLRASGFGLQGLPTTPSHRAKPGAWSLKPGLGFGFVCGPDGTGMAQEGAARLKGTSGFADGPEEAIRALIEVHRHLGPGSWNLRYGARVCAELAERGSRLPPQNPSALPSFLCTRNEGILSPNPTEAWFRASGSTSDVGFGLQTSGPSRQPPVPQSKS
jgi:hypothetical protein